MRREVLFAIVLGVGLGALVAFGLWRANLIFSPNNTNPKPLTEITSSPSSQVVEVSDLIVTSPEDNLVVSDNTLKIPGSATPRATIVILTPADEEILEAKNDGSFEAEVEISGGPNEILVKSYDENGRESTQKLNVVYSTELTASQ
ncbi:MAG: hypothetical protein Q7R44_00590 [bacterium]|nr:hypothetical protein [bacterium]